MIGVVLACSCATTLRVQPDREPQRARAPAHQVAQGSLVTAQMRESLSTERSRTGDRFSAELLDPLYDDAGEEVLPRGAVLEGVVEQVAASNLLHPTPKLQLGVTGVRVGDTPSIPLPLEVADVQARTDSRWVGGLVGAVTGLALGSVTALIVDGSQGSVVAGATLAGLGLGSLLGAWSLRRDAYVPSGAVLTLRARDSIPSHVSAVFRRPEHSTPRNTEKEAFRSSGRPPVSRNETERPRTPRRPSEDVDGRLIEGDYLK